MLDEGVDVRRRVGDLGAVRRPEQAVVTAGHLAQRVEVGAHVAVGRRHHRGAPAHHVVAGEQRRLLVEGEAQVVRRVAGRVHAAQRPALPACAAISPSPTATSGAKSYSIESSVPGSSSSGSTRVRPHRRPARGCGPNAYRGAPVSSCSQAASGEWSTWQWVTAMATTRSPASAPCERVAMRVEQRAGIDHGDVAVPDDVGAGAAVRVLRRVLGDHPAHQRRHAARRRRSGRRRACRTAARSSADHGTDPSRRAGRARGSVRRGRRALPDVSTPSTPRAASITGVRARDDAVGDLQRHRPTVGHRRRVHAVGTLLGQQTGDRPHQPGDVPRLAADEIGMLGHRPVDVVPIRGQRGERPRQTGEVDRVGGCPTPVDPDVGDVARQLGDDAGDVLLQRVVGGQIAADAPIP